MVANLIHKQIKLLQIHIFFRFKIFYKKSFQETNIHIWFAICI